MAFRQSELQSLKTSNPDEWAKRVRAAITRHRGIVIRAAADLDVSYATMKRWVDEDREFRALIRQCRKAAKDGHRVAA